MNRKIKQTYHFFINHGLDLLKWRKINMDVLFIVNDNQCEVMIPKKPNVYVLKRNYNGEYDIGSYRIGINYFENKYKKKFYNMYDYLFIMNCGVLGPFFESNRKNHWIDPFLNKLIKENSVICSPVINFLNNTDAGGPGPRCQTYCSMIKITPFTYKLLLNTKISNLADGTVNKNYKRENDFILKKHNKHYNTILIGEYGLTRIFLKNKLKISCLIYDNLNYFDNKVWNKYPHRVDRSERYKEEFLNKAVFIKNNWVINSKLRDSYPVLYNRSISYVNQKFNMKNIFNEYKYKKNYELLKINNDGKINNQDTTWTNKKDFYKKFGHSEEHILWPKQKENNRACVLYAHYDKDNIVKDYVIQGLKTLMILDYDIIFCTTSSTIKNVDLPFKVKYFQNHKNISSGNDLLVWSKILQNNNLEKYDWILLANDSILLPIHGIENMKISINGMREKNDFWGLYLSNEFNVHLCSCFIEYNKKCINHLKNFYKINIPKCNRTLDIITKIETKQTLYLSQRKLKYNGIVRYDQLIPVRCIMFHPINTHKYMNNKKCFGFKWKYLCNYINYSKLNNPFLNYLLRYIKISKHYIPEIRSYKWKTVFLSKTPNNNIKKK